MLTEDTPEAVAEALVVLLADPGLRKQPGEEGLSHSGSRTWDTVAREMAEVYQKAARVRLLK